MPLNKGSIFYDLLNISTPWEIGLIRYSKITTRMDITLGMSSQTLECPICGHSGEVVGQRRVIWKYLDLFEYRTYITTFIPKTEGHKSGCIVERDQTALSNTLLLDLMVKILKDSKILSPLHFLFKAVDLTSAEDQDLPRRRFRQGSDSNRLVKDSCELTR